MPGIGKKKKTKRKWPRALMQSHFLALIQGHTVDYVDLHVHVQLLHMLQRQLRQCRNSRSHQILFSFSTDKDRRTDSRIRRKTQRSPAGNRTQGLANSSRTL